MRQIEISVGMLLITGFFAFVVLAYKVSGLSQIGSQNSFIVTASFDNIGDLKVRAPVTVAGVKVGEVSQITLDKKAMNALVKLRISAENNSLPSNSSAKILTQGILGSNYISLTPGFDGADEEPGKKHYLNEGSVIEDTQSAIILENLISQFLFNANKK